LRLATFWAIDDSITGKLGYLYLVKIFWMYGNLVYDTISSLLIGYMIEIRQLLFLVVNQQAWNALSYDYRYIEYWSRNLYCDICESTCSGYLSRLCMYALPSNVLRVCCMIILIICSTDCRFRFRFAPVKALIFVQLYSCAVLGHDVRNMVEDSEKINDFTLHLVLYLILLL